jgi:hypothetical protein
MSKTFIISIEGDANADAFLKYVQDTKTVRVKSKINNRSTELPVLFIYPTTDTMGEPGRPDHRSDPHSGSGTISEQDSLRRNRKARKR